MTFHLSMLRLNTVYPIIFRPSVVRLFTYRYLVQSDYHRFPHVIEDENIYSVSSITIERLPITYSSYCYLSWSSIFDVADRIGRGLSVIYVYAFSHS